MTRDIMIRKLPDETYETIRRIAFEAGATHADVIAYAIGIGLRYGSGPYASNEAEMKIGEAFSDVSFQSGKVASK